MLNPLYFASYPTHLSILVFSSPRHQSVTFCIVTPIHTTSLVSILLYYNLPFKRVGLLLYHIKHPTSHSVYPSEVYPIYYFLCVFLKTSLVDIWKLKNKNYKKTQYYPQLRDWTQTRTRPVKSQLFFFNNMMDICDLVRRSDIDSATRHCHT